MNALFANAGNARRIAFAIDLSGSMQNSGFSGMNRIDVVKLHLGTALKSMEGVKGAAFGIATFTGTAEAPLGHTLIPATSAGVARGLECISNFRASGGNGGEPQCLNILLGMAPQAVFFLGDGGWDAPSLIETAKQALGATIHSIAFFTSGGGLKEIADLTGGTYREVNSAEDLEPEAPTAATPRFKPQDGDNSEEDTDSGDDDTDEDEDTDSGDSSN